MLRRIVILFGLPIVILSASAGQSHKNLSASDAKAHVGEQATICGKVVSTRFAETTHGSPTFLNFDQPYPNQIFTLLIWGSDRSRFGDPETSYRGKRLCVTGKISSYKGIPEVVATDPSQVKLEEER